MGDNAEVGNRIIKIGKGILISIILTLVLLFIFSAILTYSNNIPEATIPTVILIITGLSILIGSSISTIKLKKNGIINGGIIGGLYITLLYILSSILKTGFEFNTYSIIIIAISIVAGMIRWNCWCKYKRRKIKN